MNPQHYTEHPTKISDRVEILCQLGCTRVKQILGKAKSGEEIVELSDCDRAEIRLIIDELNTIMTVYDKDD